MRALFDENVCKNERIGSHRGACASIVFESVPLRISLGQFQTGKCLYKTVTDLFSQGILVGTVLAYLKLSPYMVKSTVTIRNSQ